MMLEQTELKQRLTWLVNLRWGGVLGVLISTHVAREIAALSFSLIPVYLILGTVAACNAVYQWRLRHSREDLRRLAVIQIILDQVILTLAVYFSGGTDSPFLCFFIFHVVISGIILSWKYAFALSGIAVLLPSLMLGLQHLGILPHYGIFEAPVPDHLRRDACSGR